MVQETERMITSLRETELTHRQSSLKMSVYTFPFANLSLAAAKPGLIFS
jgi:hypothetical protein